jgi:hypothetical protein
MSGKSTSITNPDDGKEKTFTFDFSYNSHVPRDDPSYASQGTVWDDIGAGVLTNAYNGFNCSLFAYGQTGSGKSYSMMGYGEDKGIIPIMCNRIFDRVKSNTDPDMTIRIEASMLEIYMEKVKDLFNPSAGELKVRLNPAKGFYIENLSKNAVGDFPTIEKLMDAGTKARTVAATAMNATSSRAHTIFQLTLTQTKVDRAANKATDKVALINLIDLAGSERADSTGATGDRLKEGSAINLSLSSLGNVISALAANSDPDNKKKVRVPFRDSVLTMLLENSLGGNSKTIMIAAVSPADINYDETLGTLRYADRAKQIKCKAVVNEDPNEKMLRGLKEEIERLKKALEGGGGSGGGGLDAASLEEEKAKMRAEIERELQAKLQEEKSAGMSWEEKIAETNARQAAREKELKEMGILSGAEREQQVERAKTETHIVNLNEDPMLDKNIMFFLDIDKKVTVGRKDSSNNKDIKLAGLSILKDHAVIMATAGGITVEPSTPGAKLYVNGSEISKSTPVKHGSRIIFGTNHVYMVIVPSAAASGVLPDGTEAGTEVDFNFAVNEMNKGQLEAMAAEEAKRKAEIDEERRKADAKLAEFEAKAAAERAAAAKDAEEKAKALEEQMKALHGNEQLLAKLREEQEEAKIAAEKKTKELEEKLNKQIEETRSFQRKKERDNKVRSLLDEKLLKTLPLINEANALCDEMGKGMMFEPKLMAVVGSSHHHDKSDQVNEKELETDVHVKVEYQDRKGAVPIFWPHGKFVGKLFAMREIYQAWVEHNHSLIGTEFENLPLEKDPFYDAPEDMLVGRCTLFLTALQYVLPIEEYTPVINYAGKDQGELMVRIFPHLSASPPKGQVAKSSENPTVVEDEEEDLPENLSDLIGKRIYMTVFIDSMRGLPAAYSHGSYVKFNFYHDDDVSKTSESVKKMNPTYFFYKTFSQIVTDDFVKFCSTHALEFEVWAKPPPVEVKAVVKAIAAPAPLPAPVHSPIVTSVTVTPKETIVASPVTISQESQKPASPPAVAPEATTPKIKASAVAPSDVKPQNNASSNGGCCTIA